MLHPETSTFTHTHTHTIILKYDQNRSFMKKSYPYLVKSILLFSLLLCIIPFYSIPCWSPGFTLCENTNKNFSTPEGTYSGKEAIAGPGREDRHSNVCWISSSGNQAHLFSVFCYTELFLSTEEKKTLYLCGCNTLAADISQQFHSVSWISFCTVSPFSSVTVLCFTEAPLTSSEPLPYQSALAIPSPTSPLPQKGRSWVWIRGEKFYK